MRPVIPDDADTPTTEVPLAGRNDSSALDAMDAPTDATVEDASADIADPQTTGTLTVLLFRVPDNTPPDASLHLAGNFNAWAPAASDARFTRDGARWRLHVTGLRAGQRLEYKVTRGSWATVERDDRGRDIANRVHTFDPQHPIVALYVERWADRDAPTSTRSGNVQVLRDVPVPQLGRTRDVWIYLPPGYDSSETRHRVVYLYDGQNVFDARTAAFGREWRLDEALEALILEGRLPPTIAVALANGPERPCEYNVFASDPHPGCADHSALGDRTNAFVVETLKPYIDRTYRTLSDREHTAVIGSSMGGSMAVRLGFSRPDLFSRVGALSPSYQNTLAAVPAMPAFVRAMRPLIPRRLYQDMGSIERIRDLPTELLVRNMNAVRDAARDAGLRDEDNRAWVVPAAGHDEDAWAARIRDVLLWLWR
jgi:predicted alpha/beta superfamily hydrolase